MYNYAKLAAAAAALVATPALSAPVGVTGGSGPPSASARIVKPLTLTATGALNFGVVVIPAGGVTADRTVTLNTDTTITCDTELVCAGDGTIPTYNVAGTQGQTVTIIKTAFFADGLQRGHASAHANRASQCPGCQSRCAGLGTPDRGLDPDHLVERRTPGTGTVNVRANT